MTNLDKAVGPGTSADLGGTELVHCSMGNFHLAGRFRVGQVVLDSWVLVDLVDMFLGKRADLEEIELVRYSRGNFHLVDNFQVDLLGIPGNWGIHHHDLGIHHQTGTVHLLANHMLAIEHSNEFQDHMTSRLSDPDRTDKI